MRVAKTIRTPGFRQAKIPKGGVPKSASQIGTPIKFKKVGGFPKGAPKYGSFPKGLVC